MPTAVPVKNPAALMRANRWLGSFVGPLSGLIIVAIYFAVADYLQDGADTFLTVRNLRTVVAQTATVSVAALGMTLVIITGGIDLSAGTTLALCAVVLAFGLREEWGVAASISAALGVGAVVGFINGALISLLRVVPFIITLGAMTICLGLSKIIAEATIVRPRPEQVPHWLSSLVTTQPVRPWLVTFKEGAGAGDTWGIPNFGLGFWIALALSALLAATLRYSVFGRHVFAIGSSEPTARLCGVNVPLVKTAVYTLSGLFVGVAAVFQFSRLSAGNPTSGTGMELRIIAAVVIGGGSLSGGQGSILGTLTGAAIMGVIYSGCTILEYSNPLQDIILGVIIIATVALDQYRRRRSAA